MTSRIAADSLLSEATVSHLCISAHGQLYICLDQLRRVLGICLRRFIGATSVNICKLSYKVLLVKPILRLQSDYPSAHRYLHEIP